MTPPGTAAAPPRRVEAPARRRPAAAPTRRPERRTGSDDPGTGPVLAGALGGLLGAAGGAAFTSAFAARDLLVPVLVAAVGGAVVSAGVTGLLRRRLALASFAAVAVFAALAVPATGSGPQDLLTGLRDGPRAILTSAVPTPAGPTVLLVPFAVTAAAAFLGAETAQRTRSAAGPVVPSLVALVVGLAFGFDGSRPAGWLAAAWAALAAVTVGLRLRAGPPGARPPAARARVSGVRHALAVVPVALLVAAAGHVAGPHLPGAAQRERFELRDLVEQPSVATQLTNPLVLMADLRAGDDQTLFVAETSEPVTRWRLATLDAYDGRSWYSDVTFLPAGRQLPPPLDDAASGDGTVTVTQTIELVGLEGQWLPAAGRPVEVSIDDVLFDSRTGMLLSPGPLPNATYEVTSVVPAPDAAALAAAEVATDDEAERALALPPDVPEEITELAEAITAGSSSAYMRASAIERYLAQSTEDVPFRLAVERPPSGHSFGHLRCFLFDTERCERRGSTEQFVAAYALLARSAGLPTRVVVGFVSSGGDGRDEVTAHQVTAWTEVRFDGIGWVPFNPVPNPDVSTASPPADVAGGRGGPDAGASPADDVSDGDGAGDSADTGASASGAGGGPLPWLVLGAVAVVGLVAAPPVVRSLRRRRRRRAAAPADRVAGAWAEAVDHLVRAGVDLKHRREVP